MSPRLWAASFHDFAGLSGLFLGIWAALVARRVCPPGAELRVGLLTIAVLFALLVLPVWLG